MGKIRYAIVLVMVMVVGLIGGVLSVPLGDRLLPHKLLPKEIRARKGFEIVDKHGKLRARLDKEGLTFFDEEGKQVAGLSVQEVSFSFSHENVSSSVRVSPTGPCVINFGQSENTPRSSVVSSILVGADLSQPSTLPKLGCGTKDGKVIWQVP